MYAVDVNTEASILDWMADIMRLNHLSWEGDGIDLVVQPTDAI